MVNKQKLVFTLSTVGALFFTSGLAQAQGWSEGGTWGAVFSMTNEAGANAVVRFGRSPDGALGEPTYYETRGKGTGASLASQGAVTLSQDGRWLFVVDAGSNDIAVFLVTDTGLLARGTYPSNGTTPVSVTSFENEVFVLNAGGTGNIAGFTLTPAGKLQAIPNSILPLSSAAAGAAEIHFTPDGRSLLVTEKNTNNIDTYRLSSSGALHGPTITASASAVPYGFGVMEDGAIIVSEASTSSLSSYALASTGKLKALTSSSSDGQAAACWVAVSDFAQLVYTSNAGTNTISGYSVDHSGHLKLLPNGLTHVTSGTPLDNAFDPSSTHLFVISHGASSASLVTYAIEGDSELNAQTPAAVGLPATTVGLAVK